MTLVSGSVNVVRTSTEVYDQAFHVDRPSLEEIRQEFWEQSSWPYALGRHNIASGIQGDGDSDDEEGEEEDPVCRLAWT